MTFQITVSGSDLRFPCEANETVLDAAERAGYSVPYSCRKGACLACECALLSGEASVGKRGMTSGPATGLLLCQARPTADLKIAPKWIKPRQQLTRSRLKATIYRVSAPNEEVSILQLRFPLGKRVKFLAGQYVQVVMQDGASRNYSMANPPHSNDGVELHIRRLPGGQFSEVALPKLQIGDELELELPYGEFNLSGNEQIPAILIATSTGFAPIKSMVEDQIKRRGTRRIHFYWGGRHREDLYMSTLVEKWAANFPWFSYTPVLSKPAAGWDGKTGYVQNAVLQDRSSLADVEIYACGKADMILSAKDYFISAAGMREESFHSDLFVPTGA